MAELFESLRSSFERNAKRVVHRLGHETLSYAELDAGTAALAQYLSARIPRGEPVMVYGERSRNMLIGMLGCFRAGNPYIPAGELLPPERCLEMAKAAGCRVVLGAGPGAEALVSGGVEVIADGELREILAGAGGGWDRAVRGDEVAYVLFTSGSTGAPKGVKVSAGNLESFLSWTMEAFRYDSAPRAFLNQAPFHFDLSVYELFNAAVSGGSILSLPGRFARQPEELFAHLFAYAPVLEVWVSTPSFLRYCVSHPQFAAAALPRLRQFVLIGEVFPVPLARETLKRFPSAQVLNFYGPTEATVAHTVFEVTEKSLEGRDRIPIGYCKPGSRVFLDGGELVLAGPNVGWGYVNAEGPDKRKFSVVDGERRYRTGDLAEIDVDGLLHFRGRADTQVKVNGFRVELVEIERAVSTLPGVEACSVMMVSGEGASSWIVAFLQAPGLAKEGPLALRKRLKLALAARLPAYMVPKRFVLVDAMPLNRNGKLDQESLRSLL